jgi:hypothetical protein
VITYKRNTRSTLQAAYSGSVRIGYVESSASERWLWSLNTIQPGGGRAAGIAESEVLAKDQLAYQWVKWVNAAGLQLNLKEQHHAEVERPADRQGA